MEASDFEQISYSADDGIARIELNRPEARNALSLQLRAELQSAVNAIRDDDDIRCLILIGSGGNFCAGGDIKRQGANLQDGPTRGAASRARGGMRRDHDKLLNLMNLDIPVIAAVDGAAAGAGFSLALMADFIIASDRAYFIQSFGRLGLVPDWYSAYALPKMVGIQRAKELIYSARRLAAPEALEWGLLYRMVAAERLESEAYALARKLKGASRVSIGLAKRMVDNAFLWDKQTALEFEALSQTVARDSEYHAEGVQRFLDKQDPLLEW